MAPFIFSKVPFYAFLGLHSVVVKVVLKGLQERVRNGAGQHVTAPGGAGTQRFTLKKSLSIRFLSRPSPSSAAAIIMSSSYWKSE